MTQLSPAKQALLEQRLKGRISKGSRIPLRAARDSAPLSFAQRQMWVIDQLTPGNPAYNLPNAWRLRGALDAGALEARFNQIIRRHESLRTAFAVHDGEPLQRIHPELRITIKHVPADEARVPALAREEALAPFDLARLPLIRVTLFKLAEDDHVLLVNLHHIISDGISVALLLNELDGRLPALPVQYGDFAQWQRDAVANEAAYAGQIEYWRKQLGGRLAPLELPADRRRPARQSFRGANVFFELPANLTQDLKALGAREGCTFFMTLLAAFQVLLQRYSGQNDLVVGTPLALRTPREVEPLIGNFLNMIALRCDLSGDPAFAELLRRTRDTTLDGFSNGALPFEAMVRHLAFERDPSRNPIFQVVLQVLSGPAPRIGALAARAFPFDLGFAQFDLSLQLYEDGAGYRGRFEYCTDLFEAATIRRLCAHWLTLLEAVVRDPSQAVSRLPLPVEAEQRQAVAYPRDGALHERFARQVERSPDAVAVVCEGERLSYAELDRRAERLAQRLRRRGVRAGDIVGLHAERSIATVVGILGILKAGGAYLPLDPAYPQERIAFMLEDSGASLVVTREEVSGQGSPSPSGNAEDLAYVIYTSGSTGKPKGVLVTHYNVTRLFDATEAWYGFGARDVWTLFHSFAFDFSVWELWGALLYGGRVVIVPYFVSRSPEALRDLLVRERVTVLNQTPSAFRQLMQTALPAELDLRYVIFGGEALELQSLRPWFERYGDARPCLVNMYGITETTVHVTYRPIRRADVDAGRGSVIGVPIPDLQVHILDPNGKPAPIGVPGEIYVGGAGVARGYLNRPELTAERFVNGLYRSGDRARRLENGDIEYLGRLDHQVKIRGHRIELGEVEAAIARHPGVREVAVLSLEDRLVAYVAGGGDLRADEVRTFLRQSLPEYMVPAHFVTLERLPLTENGKIDRRTLLQMPIAQAARAAAVPPRTATEERVIKEFRAVLGREDFGVLDNFFDLGGHSVVAARLMSRLNMPLRYLFENPTVGGLAEAIDRGVSRQADGIVPMQPRGTRIPIYAVPGHNADVFAFLDLARRLGEDQPFFGLQVEPLERVEDVAASLARQIRAFQPSGPFVIAGYCAGGSVAFELARQLKRAGAEPAFLALFGCAHPSVYRFNLRHWAARVALHASIAAALPSFRARWAYLAERWRARLRQLHVDKAQSRLEQATLAAARRYTPQPYSGRVCHFLPKRGWLPGEGGAARWRAVAPRTEEYYGPDHVEAERMLLDPHAAVFADFYRKCSVTPPRAAGKPLACVIGDLSMVRALGRDGIPVAVAASHPASKVKLSRYCKAEVRTPSWVDDPEGALAALLAWGAGQREAPVVFYQGDHDMLALSRGRSRLAPHLRCVLPPAELVETLADKLRFAALAERLGLPVPLTLTLPRGSELRGWHRFPCVVKPVMRSPRFAQLARNQKAILIRDRSEMAALLTLIEGHDTDFVVQQAIDGGEEYVESYHAYLRPGGQIVGEFTGRKLRTWPLHCGYSTYVEITDTEDVRRLGRSVLEKVGFSGVVKLDFKRDPRSLRLYLLEINPRFNLWHHPGAAAGVSIPALVYRDCLEPGSARPAGPARAGVRWVNAHDDWRAYQGSSARWLAGVLTADINESFLVGDPLPALDDALGILHRKLATLREARPYLRSAR